MKSKYLGVLVSVAFLMSGVTQAAGSASEHQHHSHASSAPQTLQLNAGSKWKTDATLRQVMNDINQAMTKALPRIHRNEFSNEGYQALARTIGQEVAHAVEHCKLEPKADGMLHLLIAELMGGAEAMEGKTTASRKAGAVRVREALKAYGKYFQHPGWTVPRG
ncbi:hypothetical protein ETQ85_23260 [Zoogloea oleivorans]|jgi:GTP cyclohydrolase II|uniref:DnrO protein n=1 Tax=Zoogloea oleivorans TaxID=1552750 RepID=A0A6C2CE98_9RHOO|nr:hypothetical protein [Zoogloea oleivorans]MBT9497060.1 hypothetical protein [Zoogloea sp.]TYC52016.1 hypothetical protein ETQ85_23260 [Zoogloea oleivorans]